MKITFSFFFKRKLLLSIAKIIQRSLAQEERKIKREKKGFEIL